MLTVVCDLHLICSGFLEFEVLNATHAAVRMIRADDGTVHDEGVLTKTVG